MESSRQGHSTEKRQRNARLLFEAGEIGTWRDPSELRRSKSGTIQASRREVVREGGVGGRSTRRPPSRSGQALVSLLL